MNDINNPFDGFATGTRRMRPNNAEEQGEMIRLGRHLLAANVSREELRSHLGYSTCDELDVALSTGRASTIRLERLREFADARLPDIVRTKQQNDEATNNSRAEMLAERFRSHAEQLATQGTASAHVAPQTSLKKRAMKRERRKDYCTPKQQERLVSQIDHLWAVDKRFKNWSLLAHIAGLSSGPAIKRAYEVGSSTNTLKRIDNFVRIYQAFGSRAFEAARQGIATDDLQKYLMATTDMNQANITPIGTAASAQTAQIAAPEPAIEQYPTLALDTLPPTPPTIDFANLLAVASTVDTEVKRLWLTAAFFEKLAASPSMPSIIRQNAAGAAERIREGLRFFAPDGNPGVGQRQSVSEGRTNL